MRNVMRARMSAPRQAIRQAIQTADVISTAGMTHSSEGRPHLDEWTLSSDHATTTAAMIASISADDIDKVAIAVRHHHEGYDGMGYPDGLVGENIPVLSRVISLADSYDAMATPRPYHAPREHVAIMAIIRGQACAHYDPWMLGKFAQLIETSPYRADRHVDT